MIRSSDEALLNPYVFVVGCPRSGTTLMQRMLDAHPVLTVANDTHFITRAAKRELCIDANPRLDRQLVDSVLSYHRFHRMGLDRDSVLSVAARTQSYAQFVSGLYDLRATQAGKTLSGEKTPDYCRKMPTLHSLFPSARFLHVIRDGRDTALSTLRWASKGKGPGRWDLWQKDPVGCCALWWRWQVGAGRRDGSALGDSVYREVYYEKLVAEPASELSAICGFLGIPFDDQMPRFHEGKTRPAPGRSAKSAWLGPVSGLRDWRRDMSDEDAMVFDGIAGEVLDNSGYDREPYPQSPSARARVLRCLAWWSERGMNVKAIKGVRK
jgi:hypothetical protein